MGGKPAKLLKVLSICACLMCLACMCAGLLACQKSAEVPDKVVSHVDNADSSSSSATSNESTSQTSSNATSQATSGKSQTKMAVAYVTETGSVDANAYNSGIWAGVQQFVGTDSAYSSVSYTPASDSPDARTAALKQAVDKGATVVVCSGSAFSTLLPSVAKDNPDVAFLLMDSAMTDSAGATVTASNVHCITFKEQEAGYLLGYALVKEGYRGLGFCGGKEVPAVQRFGYGFIQGAEDACTEDGVAADTYMAYWYSDTFTATDGVQTEVARWYDNGVDVVFSCGGGIFDNVLAAANEAGKPLAGADTDQGAASDHVLTSATKNLQGSVSAALLSLAGSNGTWDSTHAGTTENLGVAEGGVGLSTGSWRLSTFTVDEYSALAARVASGEVTVSGDIGTLPQASFQLDVKSAGL